MRKSQAKTHDLKTWPAPFREVKEGRKTFELRKNDRDYKVGHILRLQEYIPELHKHTGEECLVRVTHILKKPCVFMDLGEMCIMSIKK